MGILENPVSELDTLVQALSEMAAPYGYAVEFFFRPGLRASLRAKTSSGDWTISICQTAGVFIDEKSAAEALVSMYGGRKRWSAYFYKSRDALSFPGGSPEELARKAAAGVKAALYKC